MSAERSLDGRATLITGASAGIGQETARVFAREGADVTIAARREERLRELAEELEAEYGTTTAIAPTDVSDEDQVEAMVGTAVSTFGGLDVVVSNAAIGTSMGTAVEDTPTDEFKDVMSVNTDGMFYTTRAVLPHLRDRRGLLIFVGSFAGNYPRPHGPIYAATKWWTKGFALSLAGNVGQDDVGVSIVSPAEVRTEFGKEYREQMNYERMDPGEAAEPADVAEAIGFAATQEPPNVVTELNFYRRDKFANF